MMGRKEKHGIQPVNRPVRRKLWVRIPLRSTIQSLGVFPFFLNLCAGASIWLRRVALLFLGGLPLFSALSFPFNLSMNHEFNQP